MKSMPSVEAPVSIRHGNACASRGSKVVPDTPYTVTTKSSRAPIKGDSLAPWTQTVRGPHSSWQALAIGYRFEAAKLPNVPGAWVRKLLRLSAVYGA